MYAIGDGSRVKIGHSADPEHRLATLQTGNSAVLTLLGKIEVPDDRALLVEQKIHREYRHKHKRGEWFNFTEAEAISILAYAEIRWVDDPLLDL